ncbi:GPI inositol-deacylase [Biomphalaria glabrata]|uniref:GPI inositol-deacylase n=3 Tax=Biomphalaria glabrata TaxID=6526 RepID=A0A9W2ZS01_BIOGL|nr:GPI inositol-deacylase-like [Biomphalaria glabrata]KAI8731496.1 GPI inositol-deacylase-like; partial [Biomphalaria glabrata]
MAAPIALTLFVGIFSIICLGFYDYLTNFENNGCEMTYMYEYPEYIEIELQEEKNKFPDYRLHAYSEGQYTQQIRKLQLKGIPVLFIPGNAGSYKQVRSLGSVALRMSERLNDRIHFNYFVADFNEELSGLYGGVLLKQTEFVNICLKKILSLYKSTQPTSVILVGHSMGGLIARALFTLPGFDHSLVNTIITQATPHQRPVAAIDADLHHFYKTVNTYWQDHAATSLRHVTVVSTGGAYRDIQVRYGLTVLDGIVAPDRAVSVSTSAVPKAWVSTDHLCSVWCRQMVLLTKRAMFDIIDGKKLQVLTDPESRMKVFRHHFVSNNGLGDYLTREPNRTIVLDKKVKWEVKVDKLWKYSSLKVASSVYFAVPFSPGEDVDSVFIRSNLTNSDWLCYCDVPDGQDRCSSCTSLSSLTRFLPPLYSNTKYVRVSDIERTNRTYIIILVMAGEKKVDLLVDHYDSNVRHLVYQMPNVYDTIISYPISATDGAALLKIANASSFYSLHLAGLALPTNTFTVIVEPFKCRRHSAEFNEGSILRLNVPWGHEDVFTFASYGKEISLAVKLQTGRPMDHDWRQDASEPHLEMFLHPYCHYRLKLVVATQDAIGQGVRFYGLLLPGFVVAVLFMTLRAATLTACKGSVINEKLAKPYNAILDSAKPYYIVPVALLLRYLCSLGSVSKMLKGLHIPADDTVVLKEENIYFSLLPLILYISSWVLTYLHATFAYHLMKVLSYLGFISYVLPKAIKDRCGLLQFVIGSIALSLSLFCGTLGLLIISALLILKLLSLLYSVSAKEDTQATHLQIAILFPVTLLVNIQTLLGLGSLVVWMKLIVLNGFLFQPLRPDPSQMSAVITCICVLMLLNMSNLNLSKFQGLIVFWSLYCLAVMSILYASVSMYRLPILIAGAVLAVTLPHVTGLLSRWTKERTKKGE